jgi:hypothetical protein
MPFMTSNGQFGNMDKRIWSKPSLDLDFVLPSCSFSEPSFFLFTFVLAVSTIGGCGCGGGGGGATTTSGDSLVRDKQVQVQVSLNMTLTYRDEECDLLESLCAAESEERPEKYNGKSVRSYSEYHFTQSSWTKATHFHNR